MTAKRLDEDEFFEAAGALEKEMMKQFEGLHQSIVVAAMASLVYKTAIQCNPKARAFYCKILLEAFEKAEELVHETPGRHVGDGDTFNSL